MALALVLVALIAATTILGSLYLVRPYVERAFSVLDRVFPSKEGNGPSEPLPPDILAHINRLQRKESRESEEAYFRELHSKLGGWENVRIASGLAGNMVEGG